LEAIMEYEREAQHATCLTLIWDFSKAHRRLEGRRRDGGFQAYPPLHTRDELGLNTVGTFGIGSISY
jgi:hypothetical protein